MTESSDPKHPASAQLRAGAGRARIELPAELFPTEGFSGVHDPLHARVLLLECGERVALVSIEFTSLPEEQVGALRSTVGEVAGLPVENVWICVTHTMSAPHVMTKGMCKTPADGERSHLLSTALEAAVRDAACRAVNGLQEARMGHGRGVCDVNVNRDVPTAQGWWLGFNETGFSDKTLTVLRFESVDGHLLALLFSHSVRPAVMERPPGEGEGNLVTADLAGAASQMIEEEYGDCAVALFVMGAAGDQAPALTGGNLIAEMLGARLGAEVVRVAEDMVCRGLSRPLVTRQNTVRFAGQQMTETRLLEPTTGRDFLPGPDRQGVIAAIGLGDVALVGVSPELSSSTGVSIRDRSPMSETLVLTMVNGAAKYMADLSAYDRVTYEAMNSPFARGSAEILVEEAVGLLLDMAG